MMGQGFRFEVHDTDYHDLVPEIDCGDNSLSVTEKPVNNLEIYQAL